MRREGDEVPENTGPLVEGRQRGGGGRERETMTYLRTLVAQHANHTLVLAFIAGVPRARAGRGRAGRLLRRLLLRARRRTSL
jgi:hypothetical protein